MKKYVLWACSFLVGRVELPLPQRCRPRLRLLLKPRLSLSPMRQCGHAA